MTKLNLSKVYNSLAAFLDVLRNQIFNFWLSIFLQNYFTFTKMSKDSSAKHYQDNKAKPTKKAREGY